MGYFQRGSAFTESGQYEKAIADYEQVIRLRWRGALPSEKVLSDLRKKAPEKRRYAAYYAYLASLLSQMGDYVSAVLLCNQALSLDASSAEALNAMSVIFGKLGGYQEAQKFALDALAQSPGSALAHYNLSVTYFYEKKFSLACEQYQQAKALGYAGDPEFVRQLLLQCPGNNTNDRKSMH